MFNNEMAFKKIINDPYQVVDEMVEGIVLAHSDLLKFANNNKRAVVRKDAPIKDKVGILIGGGSGHEPAFLGYVGKGLADGAAIGNVFASPSPDPIVDATKAINGGKGVVYMYGNYAGDIMNFDMAAEMCQMEDIPVKTVLVTDDIASAPLDKKSERRGVAGDFYVFKIAGVDKIYTVTATPSVSSGGATIAIDPALASSPADNAALTFLSTSRENGGKTRFSRYNYTGTEKVAIVDGVNVPALYNGSLFTALNDAPVPVLLASFTNCLAWFSKRIAMLFCSVEDSIPSKSPDLSHLPANFPACSCRTW